MFSIRKEQMELFGRRQRESFVGRMAGYLVSELPDRFAAMSNDAVRAWASAAAAKAERYGVVTEPEAAQLMLLLIVLGANADETTPWVRETLADGGLSPLGKVRELVRLAREHGVRALETVVVSEIVGST